MMATIFLLCVTKIICLKGYFEDPRVEIKGRYDIWFWYKEELDVELFVDWKVFKEFVVKEEKKFKDTIEVCVSPEVMRQFILDLETAYNRLNSVDEDTVTLNTTFKSEGWGIIEVTKQRGFRGLEMEHIEWVFTLVDVDYSSDIFLRVCLIMRINPMTDRERLLIIFLPKEEIEGFFAELRFWESLKMK